MKLNSKCIKDLNVRPNTLTLLEKKVGNSLELIAQEKRLSREDANNMGIKTNNK